MQSPSYLTNHIHFCVNRIDWYRERRGERICLFWLNTISLRLDAFHIFSALTFIPHHYHSDWFQLNMSTFSVCALIQGHHKTGTKFSQPIYQLFLKLNSSVQNLLFQLCNGIFLYKMCSHLRFKIRTRFVSSVFIFSPKFHFPFLRLKKAH